MKSFAWKALHDAALSLVLLPVVLALPACGDGSSEDGVSGALWIEISVSSDSGRVGALQFDIRHLGDEGGFSGSGDSIECTALVEAIVAANYDGDSTARIGMINLHGFQTPTTLMRCGFRSMEDVFRRDFEIEVLDASDTSASAIEPLPTLVVSAVLPR